MSVFRFFRLVSFQVFAVGVLTLGGACSLVSQAAAEVLSPQAVAFMGLSRVLPQATEGVSYLHAFGSGGAGEEWSLVGGGLPSGLQLTSGGNLQGTPSTAGLWRFTIRGVSQGMFLGDREFDLTVVQNNVVSSSAGNPVPCSPQTTVSHPAPAPSPSPSVLPPGTTRAGLLQNLTSLGIPLHGLIRPALDPSGVNPIVIYYVGRDGMRHPFLTNASYYRWYQNTDAVRVVEIAPLGSVPLGRPIGHRPGAHMVQFGSSPHLYVVQGDGTLWRLDSSSVALALYGSDWGTKVVVWSDAYYGSYQFRTGGAVMSRADYDPHQVQLLYTSPDALLSTR